MSVLSLLFIIVAVLLMALGLLAYRRRMLARMAIRSILRRKTHAAIVVAGLMVATAMISGGLVVGDTLDHVIKQEIYESTGHVDIVAEIEGDLGSRAYFDQSIAGDLVMMVDDLDSVDGVQPAIIDRVSVVNTRTQIPFPQAMIFGFDFQNVLNPLVDANGETLEDVPPGMAVINEKLADEINAVEGDQIIMIAQEGRQFLLEAVIASDEGAALFMGQATIFVSLQSAQSLLGVEGMVNALLISNLGGVTDGHLADDRTISALATILPTAFSYDRIKADGVRAAEQSGEMVSQVFVVMSSFAIIAGIALIVNIFVMLAEERKREMGISRAIGMQRGDLTQEFVFEGALYALMASAVGAFIGLLIAAVMVTLFANMFADGGVSFTLHFETESLVIAAFAGFIITMATVIVASWRVSKMNIVRAIRDIPEPPLQKSDRRYFLLGLVGIVIGIAVTLVGIEGREMGPISAGPVLMALGAALASVRYVHPRVPFTLAGVFILFWTLDPLEVIEMIFGQLQGNIEMALIIGVEMMVGGVLIAMFNSDLILKALMKLFGRRRSLLPVLRTAISYPMNKRFRTGLTLFIFALIMFTVIVVSMVAHFQRNSVETYVDYYSGGFEVLGTSIREIPANIISSGLESIDDRMGTHVVKRTEVALAARMSVVPPDSTGGVPYTLVGWNSSMLMDNGFALMDRLDTYESDAEAWVALDSGEPLAIVDGTIQQMTWGPAFGAFRAGPGDQIIVVNQQGEMSELTVIGTMHQQLVQGVFVSEQVAREIVPSATYGLYYFALSPGISDKEAMDALEEEFVEYGLRTYSVKGIVEEFVRSGAAIMQLFEIFLAMGLVVGIAGLGIITIRNVAERRQEVGVMRAIGYQKDQILKTFLLEVSYVALLGITIGVSLGLALSFRLHEWAGFAEISSFSIPWVEVFLITFIAFGITLLSTVPPSRAASQIPPAEALRRID